MPAELDPGVLTRMEELGEASQVEIQVIVTHVPGADLSRLEAAGLKIVRVFQAIPAVSGTLLPRRVHGLAELDSVEAIELDGPMKAL